MRAEARLPHSTKSDSPAQSRRNPPGRERLARRSFRADRQLTLGFRRVTSRSPQAPERRRKRAEGTRLEGPAWPPNWPAVRASGPNSHFAA